MEEYQRKQDASKLKNADSTKKKQKQTKNPTTIILYIFMLKYTMKNKK